MEQEYLDDGRMKTTIYTTHQKGIFEIERALEAARVFFKAADSQKAQTHDSDHDDDEGDDGDDGRQRSADALQDADLDDSDGSDQSKTFHGLEAHPEKVEVEKV